MKHGTSLPGKWRRRLSAFLHPLDPEKLRYLRARWAELPEELRFPNQTSGRHFTHCAFTLGASYCSFHCTHCYLPQEANRVPIPSLEEMRENILANRRLQGPGAGLQVTGGDVIDAYHRSNRFGELVEIVKMAFGAGLVPMVFTHGQTLLEHPELLERLVAEGGLRQVAVHIDTTQAGRAGYPIQRVKSEGDLHPVREAFTQLALQVRQKTGARVEFAHNCTVTRKNLDGVAEILRWMLADPKRSDVWRIASFQPEAQTGRTLPQEKPITPDDVWAKICEGAGYPLRRDALISGHPDCNSYGAILVDRESGRHCAALPQDNRHDSLFGQVLSRIGGLSLVADDAGTPPYRLAGVIARHPLLLLRVAGFLGRWLAQLSPPVRSALLRGRVHTFNVGIHNFMDAEVVATADKDPVIQCRLDACVFKGAVKEEGEWRAVPMCRMNESRWRRVYQERIKNPALWTQSQVPGVREEAKTPEGAEA